MQNVFNLFDLIFIAACFIFVLTAFFRGFVKEAFSLFNWAVAFVVSYLLAPYVSSFFVSRSISSAVTDIGVRSIIFVTVFVISLMSTSGLAKELKRKVPRPIDRSLGVLFGLIKTLLIFGIGYAILVNSMSLFLDKKIDKKSKEFPSFLSEAKFHDLIEVSAKVVDYPVSEFLDGMALNIGGGGFSTQKILDKKIEDILEKKMKDIDPASLEEIENLEDINDLHGYDTKDLEKLNRLIEIVR
ncbi:MAG: CvpA family protein [Rickettsiales bacterium]|nr:CvpA family protein [Rickettsiales bacterium]